MLRIFLVISCLLFIPCLAFADHSEIHSNTQAIEALTDFLTGPDMITILFFFAFITGLAAGDS